MSQQPDIGKIYLYGKDMQYKLLINKREMVGLKHYNGPNKAFIENSNDM